MLLRLTIAACFSFLSVCAWGEEGLGRATSAWEKAYVDEFDLSAQVGVTAGESERPLALAETAVKSFSVAYARVGLEYEELHDEFSVQLTLTPDLSKIVFESESPLTLRWRGDEGIDGLEMYCMLLATDIYCSRSLRFGGADMGSGDHLSALKNLATVQAVRFSGFPWRSYAPKETFEDQAFLSFLRAAAKDVLVFNSMSEFEFAKLAKEFPSGSPPQ